MVIALLTGSANAADIYYEDGTHVDVPDDWIIVTKPDDCQKSGDGNKSVRQEDQIVDPPPTLRKRPPGRRTC